VGRTITSVSVRREIHGNIVHHIMGSRTLDKVFYLIPDVEAEVQSLELLNYAQITVVRGEVTFRDMEYEFQVWSGSMGYKWRFYVKVAAEN
jgi:hypothetical protein